MGKQPQHQWMLLGAGLALLVAVALWLRVSWAPEPRWGQAQTVQADGLRVTLQLDSATTGERVIEVLIHDMAGQPVAVDGVQLRFSMTEMDMGVTDVAAQPVGPGRFRARGSFFSMTGPWAVEAIVAREAQAPLPLTFTFPI